MTARLNGIPQGGVDDQAMRKVVRAMAPTIEALLEIGREREFDAPTTGLYVLAFAEQVACLTLEILRARPATSVVTS